MSASQKRISIISTAVSMLGSGKGGGVEREIERFADLLNSEGYEVVIYCPTGSHTTANAKTVTVEGSLEDYVQYKAFDDEKIATSSVLSNIIMELNKDLPDLVLNFSYDWLALYSSFIFKCPVLHYISLCSHLKNVNEMILKISDQFPRSIGMLNKEQMKTFPGLNTDNIFEIGCVIDMSFRKFEPVSDNFVNWIGRISPEKGLEDALLYAEKNNVKLKIAGVVQDEAYWNKLKERFSSEIFEYKGYLSSEELSEEISKGQATIFTPKWNEAFGLIMLESLACGVPVIAYDSPGTRFVLGGHEEIGILIHVNDVDGLCQAHNQIYALDRKSCREYVETEFSEEKWRKNVLQWINEQMI
ncbi:glycosyltransferase [Aureibacter tunicatorum]|uniref:UDP-glucose:tetrahydrobiopterin glucosyltransferase n=1 Tax=Aureibacter tunicatorum TaxID=866807 RepID=A0AAE3XNK3_9BACT|nr:glycosyltransferase [Aureibacter tunicatorum]MDR6239243.1 UDP-glucose:tetrahydrobiopterin glucosyltransferase [Aureibacter tunicatorum]BDD04832.1 UDP-glucose--tetrahydrobiopterin glucosyltransferase [Aureibacter tunicatorum]